MDPVVYAIWANNLCKQNDATLVTRQKQPTYMKEVKICSETSTMASENGSTIPKRTCAASILLSTIRFFQMSLSLAEIALLELTLHDFTHPEDEARRPWQTVYSLATATASTIVALILLGMDFVKKRTRYALRMQIALELVVAVAWAVAALVLDMQADDEIFDLSNNLAATLRNPSVGLAAAASVVFFFSPFITAMFCQRRPPYASSGNSTRGLRGFLTSPELGYRSCELRAENGALRVVPKVRDFANEPVHHPAYHHSPSPELGRETPISETASTEGIGVAYTEVGVMRYNIDTKSGIVCQSEMAEFSTISDGASMPMSRKESNATEAATRLSSDKDQKMSYEAPSQASGPCVDAREETASEAASQRVSGLSSVHTARSRAESPDVGLAQ